MKWGKIIVLSLLSLIFSACISLGSEKFEMKLSRTYGEEKNNLAYSFQTVPDGYILAGTSFNESYDILLIKIDKDGNEIWRKTFGTPENDLAFSIHIIDGGYMIFGITGLDTRNYIIWIIKTDENGEKLWDKTLEIEENFNIGSIQQTSDGYIIVGPVQSSRGDESDTMIRKLDKDGNEVYKKILDIDGYDMGKSVKETYDGYIIAGSIFTDTDRNGLLIKINRDGEVEWSKIYNYSDRDWLQDVQIISDGYILLGYTSKKEEEYLDYGGDYMLIKTDKNGEEIWMKTYGHNISEAPTKHIENYMEDYASSVLEMHNGYVISGYTFINEEGTPTIFLVKTDKDGKELCDQLYGTEGSSFGGPMIKTGKNEFVLLANTWDPENSDIWLMKIVIK